LCSRYFRFIIQYRKIQSKLTEPAMIYASVVHSTELYIADKGRDRRLSTVLI
jgi:hypothetical protein